MWSTRNRKMPNNLCSCDEDSNCEEHSKAILKPAPGAVALAVPRVKIREILADPVERRELMVQAIIALQAREGIEVTREQAEQAYDRARRKMEKFGVAL